LVEFSRELKKGFLMKLVLDTPIDMHLHLRDEKMLELVAPLSNSFSGVLAMPNLIPPIVTKDDVLEYKARITKASGSIEPYMSIFFKDNYSKKFLEDIASEIKILKLYPSGATTNSEGGIDNFHISELSDVLNTMSDLGLILSIHGESRGFLLDREKEFLGVYELLAKSFPKLKIIMEHISTKEAVGLLERYDNLYATITAHHMRFTFDDVAGSKLNPHNFCMPVVKRAEDREALINLAISSNPKVMFGSDSAPHLRCNKESGLAPAGVFTAPISLQILAEVFESKGALNKLQAFVSDHAKLIYEINPPKKEVTLIKERYKVPNSYKLDEIEVVPMLAGEYLEWSIESVK
jgi:dihydroorotase